MVYVYRVYVTLKKDHDTIESILEDRLQELEASTNTKVVSVFPTPFNTEYIVVVQGEA